MWRTRPRHVHGTSLQARQAGHYEAALAASRRLQPQPWAALPSSQDDPDLAAAIAASLQPAPSKGAALRDLARPDAAGADPDLAAAIAASLADVRAGTDVAGIAAGREEEEEALQRALALSRQAGTAAAGGLGCEEAPIELSDDDGGATERDEPDPDAGVFGAAPAAFRRRGPRSAAPAVWLGAAESLDRGGCVSTYGTPLSDLTRGDPSPDPARDLRKGTEFPLSCVSNT